MKMTTLFISILFSGSLAFAHCGSCGTGSKEKAKPSCSKHEKSKSHHSKGDKHAKGEKCACGDKKKKA